VYGPFDSYSEEEQKAWAVLGWSAENWEEYDDYPETEDMVWEQLSKEERAAARAVGFNNRLWDASGPYSCCYYSEGCPLPCDDTAVEDKYLELSWSDLSEDEKSNWMILGWSEASWEGDADWPATEGKNSLQLTADEYAAAEALGYDWKTWDVTAPGSCCGCEVAKYHDVYVPSCKKHMLAPVKAHRMFASENYVSTGTASCDI